MGENRLQIAYLCDLSPLDRNLYSGGNARIFETLREHAGDVTVLSQSWHGADFMRRLIMSTPDHVNLRARWRAHYALRGVIARGVQRELSRQPFDVVFGAYSLHSLAGLNVPAHMVTAFTSDATQTVYRLSEVGQAHKRMFLLGSLLDNWVERREQAALSRADLLLWPSDWLWRETQDRYGLDPDRGHLVPWGANIETPPVPLVKTISHTDPLRLLVIGRDWFAKGGPIAFDTMCQLRAQGIDARLTVIGCIPPEFHVNDWVTVHPQLNKAIPDELSAFNAALDQAHFLIQPSFESYGFAFCEASAHGLPSLCLRVGGVPVWDGKNGHALPLGAGPDAFAAQIQSYLDAPDKYAELSAATRQTFEARLNWPAWGRAVSDLLSEAVARKASQSARR